MTQALYYWHIHVLYASLVASAAWALTSLRGPSATAKYWVWVATSLNFILPTGAVLDKLFTPRLHWASPLGVVGDFAYWISSGPPARPLLALWSLGAACMLARLFLRIRGEPKSAVTGATSFLAEGVPVRFAPEQATPAVDGVLRPHICLPAGIDRLLTDGELSAVLIHEVTHARRRDNLILLLHEVSRSLLWFHPLVWLSGSKLALYRELSCDERVIEGARGGELVSALAKLAASHDPPLLQATASSFMSRRLARLTGVQPRGSPLGPSLVLGVLFGGTLLASVLGTVAHTACCFFSRT